MFCLFVGESLSDDQTTQRGNLHWSGNHVFLHLAGRAVATRGNMCKRCPGRGGRSWEQITTCLIRPADVAA